MRKLWIELENLSTLKMLIEALLMEKAPINSIVGYIEVNQILNSRINGVPLNKLLHLSEVHIKQDFFCLSAPNTFIIIIITFELYDGYSKKKTD